MEKSCTWKSLHGAQSNKISSDWLIGSLAHQFGGVANRESSADNLPQQQLESKEISTLKGKKTLAHFLVKNPLIELRR